MMAADFGAVWSWMMEPSSRGRARSLSLVTGASSGIGRAFARQLAAEGYDLVLVARRREQLEVLAKELGESFETQVELLPGDLTRPEDLRRVEERLQREPVVDLLVNSAGFGTGRPFLEVAPERIEAEIRLNALATIRLVRAALPGMVARGRGAIINVSSAMGFQGNPFFANYGATKAYLTNVTQALADEFRGTGVRFQALCPGPVLTEFGEVAGIDDSGFPGFTVLRPEQVVKTSLRALEKGREVCIPGVAMRTTAWLTARLPSSMSRLFYRWFGKRYYLG
jgi:short-subunit dehydrogenase